MQTFPAQKDSADSLMSDPDWLSKTRVLGVGIKMMLLHLRSYLLQLYLRLTFLF